MNVRKMPVFPILAKIIGAKRAVKELKLCVDVVGFSFHADSVGGFVSWEDTPQGVAFWIGINSQCPPVIY